MYKSARWIQGKKGAMYRFPGGFSERGGFTDGRRAEAGCSVGTVRRVRFGLVNSLESKAGNINCFDVFFTVFHSRD